MKESNKKFIAYYRVSTDRQEKSGLGLDTQEKAVKKYLKAYWPPHESFTEVESGKNNKRPEFDKALKLCKKLKATLVVAKLDRLSRDLHFITSLDKAKIEFVCCDMPQANNLTINLMSALAQWEREQISKRTKDALQALKAQGKKLGANNPKVKKGLKVYWKAQEKKRKVKEKQIKEERGARKKRKKIEYEAKVYKCEKFDKSMLGNLKLLSHLSIREQVKKLNKSNIKTRLGKEWSKSNLHNLIKRLKTRGHKIEKIKG